MMDAPTFGAFLAETRRARGLTQRDLAERLHVTDKAVSRWERGVGLPDINTLEPLADALGLTLSQLMHADRGGAAAQSAQTLAEFFALMTPAQIAWADVRRAIFWLTIGLAVWAQCTLPWRVTIHWHWADGAWHPDGAVPGLLAYLGCIALCAMLLWFWQGWQRNVMGAAALAWLQAFHPRLGAAVQLALQMFWMAWALAPALCVAMILLLN